MIKVKMPYPGGKDGIGGITRVALAYIKHLPEFGVEVVADDADTYDLIAAHAGCTGANCTVCHSHGIWWTADMPNVRDNHWSGNRKVIQALRAAKEVTVPSPWVAHNIARDMHFYPHVVPHGIDFDEWRSGPPSSGYVLWNKGRAKDVCDPTPVKELAERVGDVQFVSTFCLNPPSNVKVIGRQPFAEMKKIVQRAGVYLATTQETFGIGVLEAMACGVPVLGYNWKGTADIVTHGECGYLAEPGNYEDLVKGLDFCIRNKERLGKAGREVAKRYTWESAVELVAQVYELALKDEYEDGVTVVIPSYMYANVVGRAIQSALNQTYPPKEIIVVDDGSKDQGATKKVVESFRDDRVIYVRQENSGVSMARNHGISLARTKLICCLDADDAIDPRYLATLVPAFKDPLLGVAYTGLMQVNPSNGVMKPGGWPPDCNFDQQLKGKNQVPTCCVYRKKAWKQIGGYRSRYVHAGQGCGSEDAEMFLRMGANGWRMRRITPEPLFLYTLGGRTWDKANYEKPLWTNWHPWTVDNIHPFASIATPVKESHPVRQYDIPLVSIVIPVGPLHPYMVVDALDSLEAQSFRRWEGVVVNDSGVDLDLSAWPYLTIVNTPGGKGAGYARNRGTEAAKGDYVIYLDADDFLQSHYLFQTLHAAEQHPGHWVYTDMYISKPTGEIESYECEEWDPALLWRRGIASVTSLYPKQMWVNVGGFNEELYREDWDFHLRLAMKGFCGIRLPRPLFTYRHATGDRRRHGSKRREIDILHRMYNREELMRGCSGCGKRRIASATLPAQPEPPANWATKADLGWPQVEFIGGNKNDLIFKGKATRRKYAAGDNQYHKVIHVHPQDYPGFLAMKYFREYKGQDSAKMVSTPKPKPPVKAKPLPAKKPDPPVQTELDITKMRVRDVFEYDFGYFSPRAMDMLIEDEKNRKPKPRTTIIAYLERQKRGLSASSDKEEGDVPSKPTNTVKPG